MAYLGKTNCFGLLHRGHLSRFPFPLTFPDCSLTSPWLLPDLREFSVTSWYSIWQKLRSSWTWGVVKLLCSNYLSKFPYSSLTFQFFSQIPWHFPDYFEHFFISLTFPWFLLFPGQWPPCHTWSPTILSWHFTESIHAGGVFCSTSSFSVNWL